MTTEDLDKAILEGWRDCHLEEYAINLATKDTTIEEKYYGSAYLFHICNHEGKYDPVVQDTLSAVTRTGITFSKAPHRFLEAIKILAQLSFKYNRLKEASNYLLFLRDLSGVDVPAWVYNYSAILLYRIDPDSVISAPTEFLRLIMRANPENCPSQNSQSVAIVGEFLGIVSRRLFVNPALMEHLPRLITSFQETFSLEVLDAVREWNGLQQQYVRGIVQSTEGMPDNVQSILSGIIELYSKQDNRLRELEAMIQELHSSLDTMNQNLQETSTKEIARGSDEIIRQIKEIAQEHAAVGIRGHQPRILVLGASQIATQHLLGICKAEGLDKDHVELHLDYDENKRYDIGKLQYCSPFDGILIGPIAHKVVGLGDNSSVIEKLRDEEGFPPYEAIYNNSGDLKITKTSFREALQRLMVKVRANHPDN